MTTFKSDQSRLIQLMAGLGHCSSLGTSCLDPEGNKGWTHTRWDTGRRQLRTYTRAVSALTLTLFSIGDGGRSKTHTNNDDDLIIWCMILH